MRTERPGEGGSEKAGFTIYLIVLFWSHLAFGAVHTGDYTFVTLGVLGASLMLAASEITEERTGGAVLFRVPSAGMNALF
ncbi:MAG: hypothetical protein JXL84_03385 [Deltaproteobacteria bacterium]|nr:hypothetical protein [Deltaproteobacteria bacterium]